MTTPAIQTVELTRKHDDKTAVSHLTLTVAPGEIFGFLGHNGAVKTTIISLLTTLLLPTSGSAAIFGDDIVWPGLSHHPGHCPGAWRQHFRAKRTGKRNNIYCIATIKHPCLILQDDRVKQGRYRITNWVDNWEKSFWL